MKVIYETSVLGESYLAERSKAGIYRVIISFLQHVQNEDDVFYCTAHKTFLHTALARKHFLEDNKLNRLEGFISPWASHPRLLEWCESIIIKISLYKTGGLLKKVQRKFLSYFFKVASSIIRQQRIESIDVYHSFFHALPAPEQVNAKARFITIYDMIPLMMPHLFAQSMEKSFKKIISSIDVKKDWVVCISESTKRDFCNYTSMDKSRVFVTPLATSDLFFPVKDQRTIKKVLEKYSVKSSKYVLALSTLEPRKNTVEVVKAFEKMVKSGIDDDLYLVLAGAKGWLFDEIFSSVSNNSTLKERIIFTGRIEDKDLSALYSGALFFVYPSLYEGFGLPPLEAMACGTAVITSNNSSLPEVVGDAGIMIDLGQEDSLLKAMLQLYHDSSFRHQLEKLSIKQAGKFSWNHCTRLTLEAYRRALGGTKEEAVLD